MLIQEDYFKNIFNTVREAILILDENMRVLSANRSFFTVFKVDAANTIGSLLYDLGNGQWNIPSLRVLLEDVLPKNDTVDDYEIEHRFESIGHKTMLLNACKIREKKIDLPMILLAIEDITERKRLEDLLTESEERYRRIFETASDGIVLLEKNKGQIIHANPAAEKMLGYSEEESVGKKLQDIGVSVDMSDFPTIMRSLNRSGILNYDDIQVKTKSGHYIDTDIYMVDRAKLAQCNIRDVSERKRKEEYLQRLNRTLLARSKSSKAMMRARDEVWYLNEVCRNIVEDCGHALVWVGFAEHDEGRTVRPVAHAGFEDGYLDSLKITWLDTERGRGPIGTAIRTGKPVFRNIGSDPAFAPWREEALKRGYAAVIGVPLLADGKAFGSLNIYSRQEDPFPDDEVQLLSDLASDLSYGIAAIRMRIAQMEAELSLRESEKQFRSLFENMLNGVAHCRMILQGDTPVDYEYIAVNPAFEKLTGLKDVTGRRANDVIPGYSRDNPESMHVFGQVAMTGVSARWEHYLAALEKWFSFAIYSPAKSEFVIVLDNITERKQAEEKLRESEARLLTLVQTIPDLVWLKDPNGVYLACNPMFERLYGAGEADIVGKTDYDFVSRELAEFFLEHDRKAMAAGKPSSNEEWLTFADDGHHALMETIKTPMFDAGGNVTGVLGIARDITERKQAEEELLKERDKAQSYFEIASVMLVVLDREGRVVLINPKGCEILGYDHKDIIGVDWFANILPVRLRDEIKGVFLKLMADNIKPVEYFENSVVTKTGVERTIAFHNTVVRDSASQIIGVLFSGEDITEQKRAEEALREAETRYHLLFDQSPDGIVIIEPATTRFLEFNETACRQLGYSREEFARLRIVDLEVAEKPEDTKKRVAKVMVEGRNDFETLQRTRQGEIRNIHVSAKFTEILGRPVYHCVWRDITEQRRIETQYLHSQKMESIGTLAGGVAHDFNNILSAIIGYGHVTLMDMAEDSPQRMNIEHILEAADRAARLTKELLLFSRKQITERKAVDLNEVVSVVEKFLRMVIGEDIECKTMLPERSIPVYADSHQLEQVLMNLATNARDAMPGGGALTIKTEQIDLAEDFTKAHGYGKSGPYAMITISDTGAGMDEATQKRIFEPFFTTKEVGKGTGLGLAVVYGIIKQHDGFINVYSEPGRGTTFRIYLPLIASEAAGKTVPRLEDAPARGTETVLLAEDDENLRKLSRKVLAEFGYTVIDAVDGEEAVKKFMENKDTIQLLLFDLVMPKMNGKEASDEIKKIKPEMKVLFTSGYDPDLLQQKELLGAGVHLIYKPLSPMDLLRKVRSVLDGATQ